MAKLLSLLVASVVLAIASGKKAKKVSNVNVKNYCGKTAQRAIAQTRLKAKTIAYKDLAGFVSAFATPYDGNETLRLSAPQFSTDEVVLCKVKSFDALNFYFGEGTAAGGTCSSVNRAVAKKYKRRKRTAFDYDDIVFEDWDTLSGPQWTAELPSVTAYVGEDDGLLHLVGKQIYVERTNESPFVDSTRKGVVNCQSISPKYLRKIMKGKVTPPTCGPPPVYSAPFDLTPWNCPPV